MSLTRAFRLVCGCVPFTLAACAGPAVRLEPRATSLEEPLAFELRDWDWNRGSFEVELRVTNHGDRTVVVERGFLSLNDGRRSMSPTSRPQTCKIAPHRTRTIDLRYPAVDRNVTAFTLEFGNGAVSFDEKQGEAMALAPLRFQVGDATAAAPSR